MMYTPMIKKALKLMYEKHKDQVDKAGMPYVLHPLTVASKMTDENTTIVALLHDIVEDTNTSLEDLINEGFSKDIIDAISCLTHPDGVDYYDYVKQIGTNEIATKVKIADLEHNSDLTRLDNITKLDIQRRNKYLTCIEYLKNIQYIRENMENKNSDDNIREKVQSGLLGFAVGDALGVPVEFRNRSVLQNNKIKDMLGYGSHNVPEGTWSDDTSLTIATMDSISQKGIIDYDDIMSRFYEWFINAKYTATDELFDIGITTRNAIENYVKGVPAIGCGPSGFRENGNGSLMRMLPFAFYLHENKMTDYNEMVFINNASSLTHGHEISMLGCEIYVDYINNILNGMDKEKALQSLNKDKYLQFYSSEVVDCYKRIFDNSFKNLKINDIKSSGYVVDSLEASLWCTINSDNFEDAVIKAVNLGEDTDTIGAITGSLNGIIYGLNSIPKRWLDKLKKKDYLEEIANNYVDSLLLKKNDNERGKVK